MLDYLPRLSLCSVLSLLNVVGFFALARHADAFGFVGHDGVPTFGVLIGVMTVLATTALLAWSVIEHLFGEPTDSSSFTIALNLGFLCAFGLV